MNAAIKNLVSPGINSDEYYLNRRRSNFLSVEELGLHIHGCVINDRRSQNKIYVSFYNYAMKICSIYTNNYDDSVEILNAGFLKVFKELYRYQPVYKDTIQSFKGWLRRIMVCTAIDHFRKNRKYKYLKELDDQIFELPAGDEDPLDGISYHEIVKSMQMLTPGYRIIFNLFIIEQFSHEEIAKQLGISIGTSKSNLARGRRQLQKILFQQNELSSAIGTI
jgi:RNA polymerase sigma-70 factor (ECF subfamily)